jgi:hypothetical protein
MNSNADNKTLRAREICDSCVKVYTQETQSSIYREVNHRLKAVDSVADGTIRTLMAVVRKACGSLAAYVFLLWEGTKLMFSTRALSQTTQKVSLFRGMRMKTKAYEALCSRTDQFVVMPAFTSFSVDLDTALGFPALGTTDPQTEVEVLLDLDSYGRAVVEHTAAEGVKSEREVLPFNVLKVVSSMRAGSKGRRVVKLTDLVLLAIEGMSARRRRMVPADQLVRELLAAVGLELRRTDLCELWDAVGHDRQ